MLRQYLIYLSFLFYRKKQIDFSESVVEDLKELSELHLQKEKESAQKRNEEEEKKRKRAEEIRKAQEDAKKEAEEDRARDAASGMGGEFSLPTTIACFYMILKWPNPNNLHNYLLTCRYARHGRYARNGWDAWNGR